MKHTNTRSKLLAAVGNLYVAFLTLLYLSSTAAAQGTITLDFNSLPSAQGWTYVSDGAPETRIFSVSGGILTQNTVAGPFTVEFYQLLGVVDPLFPFTIEARARVLQDSGNPPNEFGFFFGASTGTEEFDIGLSTNRIQDGADGFAQRLVPFDNTVFHEYRLVATPGVGYGLFVDGNLVATGPPRPSSAGINPDSLMLGDGTRGRGALAEVTRFVFSQVLEVKVDIKPGSFPNSINPKDKGTIPVAILTTKNFDATTVDPATVRFGANGTEAPAVHFALEDVDGDGDTDMVLHFRTQDTGIVCGTTSGSLTGKTLSAQPIRGTDSIRTVGCN